MMSARHRYTGVILMDGHNHLSPSKSKRKGMMTYDRTHQATGSRDKTRDRPP